MMKTLEGGCLCGTVRYRIKPGFRMNPYACHCTDCQKRTGSAFSEHMQFSLSDMTIEGELDTGEFTSPNGAGSQIFGCARCKARIFAVRKEGAGLGSLRCGTLDTSSSIEPAAHLWVSSKQPWIALAPDARTHETQPYDKEGFLELVGLQQ